MATQTIYTQYKKSKDPEKFLRCHETEILIHETDRNQLEAMGYDEVPHHKKLKKEMMENAKTLATLNDSPTLITVSFPILSRNLNLIGSGISPALKTAIMSTVFLTAFKIITSNPSVDTL